MSGKCEASNGPRPWANGGICLGLTTALRVHVNNVFPDLYNFVFNFG